MATLLSMSARDVLFIDEIHRLPTVVEEMLYSAMEDLKITILVPDNEGQEQALEVDIPPFTLVGATTRKGSLTRRCRTVSACLFGWTTIARMISLIVMRAARKLGTMGGDEALAVAKRSRGTPDRPEAAAAPAGLP